MASKTVIRPIVQSESTLTIDLSSKQNVLPSLDALKPRGGYLFLVRPQEGGRETLLREGPNPFQTVSFGDERCVTRQRTAGW